MPRVKRGMMHTKRRRGVLKATKGFRWGRKSKIKLARTAKMKAGAHAYVGRKTKKRLFRANWQININAAIRAFDMSYSKFIGLLKKKGIALNRKMLADIAIQSPKTFEAIVNEVK